MITQQTTTSNSIRVIMSYDNPATVRAMASAYNRLARTARKLWPDKNFFTGSRPLLNYWYNSPVCDMLTDEELEMLYNVIRDSDYSASVINRAAVLINKTMELSGRELRVTTVPPEVDAPRPSLSLSDFINYRCYDPAYMDHNPLELRQLVVIELLRHGMRSSEVVSLEWQHVNFDYGNNSDDKQFDYVTITAANSKNNIERRVYLSSYLTECLWYWHDMLFDGSLPSGAVIRRLNRGGHISSDNTTMVRSALKSILNKWAEENGVEEVTPIMFRRSCVSHLRRLKYDESLIKAHIGHTTTSVTDAYDTRNYRPTPLRLHRMVQRLNPANYGLYGI